MTARMWIAVALLSLLAPFAWLAAEILGTYRRWSS